MFKKTIIYCIISLGFGLTCFNPAAAEDFLSLQAIDYPLDELFTYTSPQGQVTLEIATSSPQGKLSYRLTRLVKQERIYRYFTLPKNQQAASDLYSIRFTPAGTDQFNLPPTITLAYTSDNHNQDIYYYNWGQLGFEKLDVRRNTTTQTLTFDIPNKKSVIFALFEPAEQIGKASWYVHYKYPNQLIAASRDFELDTQVKVTNLENQQSVVVSVKDYGPKECRDWTQEELDSMGPCQERIIDLSKTAFQVLAPTWEGVINVKVSAIE